MTDLTDEAVQALVAEAVAAERKRCAKAGGDKAVEILLRHEPDAGPLKIQMTRQGIAAAIRKVNAALPAVTLHVNETPKSKHDVSDMLSPAAIREAALKEAEKALRDWQDSLNVHRMTETAIAVGMAADVVHDLIQKEPTDD